MSTLIARATPRTMRTLLLQLPIGCLAQCPVAARQPVRHIVRATAAPSFE